MKSYILFSFVFTFLYCHSINTNNTYVKKIYSTNRYSYVIDYGNNLFLVYQNKKYGIVDSNSNEIISCEFDYIDNRIGYYYVAYSKGRTCLISPKGKIVIPLNKNQKFYYDNSNHHISYQINNDQYYIHNTSGRIITKQQFIKENGGILNTNIESNEPRRGLKAGIIYKDSTNYYEFNNSNQLFKVNNWFIIGYEGYNIILDSNLKEILRTEGNLESFKYLNKYFLIKKNGKYGIIKNNFKIISSFLYDTIRYKTDGNNNVLGFIVETSGKIGLMDTLGVIKLNTEYDNLTYSNIKNRFIIKQGNKYGFCDFDNGVIVPALYEEVKTYDRTSNIFVKDFSNDKWGMYNVDGDLITKPQFEELFPITNHELFCIAKQDGLKGVIRKDGIVLAKCEYNEIRSSGVQYDNFLALKKEKWGAIDSNGKILAECRFDEVDLFHNSIITVGNGLYSIKTKNKTIDFSVDSNYTNYFPFSTLKLNSQYFIKYTNRYNTDNYYSFDGKLLKTFNYTFIDQNNGYNKNIFVVFYFGDSLKTRKYGLIDSSFNEILPCIYKEISHFNNNYLQVTNFNSESSLFNTLSYQLSGLYSSKFETILGANSIYYKYNKDLVSIYDSNFNLIHSRYNRVSSVTRTGLPNLIEIEKNNLIGFMDIYGNEVIPPIYEKLNYIHYHDIMVVYKDNRWGVIDTLNKTIISFEYDKIERLDDYYHCKKGQSNRLINSKNEIIALFQFDEIDEVVDSFIKVRLENKVEKYNSRGYLDKVGLYSIRDKRMVVPYGKFDNFEFKKGVIQVFGEYKKRNYKLYNLDLEEITLD